MHPPCIHCVLVHVGPWEGVTGWWAPEELGCVGHCRTAGSRWPWGEKLLVLLPLAPCESWLLQATRAVSGPQAAPQKQGFGARLEPGPRPGVSPGLGSPHPSTGPALPSCFSKGLVSVLAEREA